MTPDVTAGLQLMLDEHQIQQTCMRYRAGVDQQDPDLFRSAFTDDGMLSLFGGERTMSATDTAARIGAEPGRHTNHSLSNQTIEVEGHSAIASSFVVAHLVSPDGPVLVRGLRYRDQLVRTADGWRIRLREHQTLWQDDTVRVEPHL